MLGDLFSSIQFLWCVIGAFLLVLFTFLLRAIRVIQEYKRGVVFTLGKFSGIRNPGLTLLIPIIQTMRLVDMRLTTAEVPRRKVTRITSPCWSMPWCISKSSTRRL